MPRAVVQETDALTCRIELDLQVLWIHVVASKLARHSIGEPGDYEEIVRGALRRLLPFFEIESAGRARARSWSRKEKSMKNISRRN